MHSPHVSNLLTTPQSRISVTTRSQYAGTPQSIMSSATTINTIEQYANASAFGRYGGYLALVGGFLFQLTLGSWFCFGNLIPYVASYMTFNRNVANSYSLTDEQLHDVYNGYLSSVNVVFFVAMCFNAILSIFGGDWEIKIGPTKTLMICALCLSLGFGCTYFALIWDSFTLICITFGVFFGCGVGIGYPVQPIVCMRWFPTKRGLVNGLINAAFGAGPFIFNPIQSKMVNPSNVQMDDRWGYTKNHDIIERIPFMFAYVAAIMFTMQMLSILCIKSPPWFIIVSDDDIKGAQQKSKSQLRYEAHSLTMRQSMSLGVFWELWTNNFLFTVALMWMTATWKVTASTNMGIKDDQIMSMIGSIGALANGLSRFLWGLFYDHTQSFRLSMGLQTGICAVFVCTLPLVPQIASSPDSLWPVLTVWMLLIWLCVGCEYAFLPSVLAETFGSKHAGALIGIFLMSEPIAVGMVVVMSMINIPFESSCLVVGGCCGVCVLLSILYRPNRIDRKRFLNESFAKMKGYQSVEMADNE